MTIGGGNRKPLLLAGEYRNFNNDDSESASSYFGLVSWNMYLIGRSVFSMQICGVTLAIWWHQVQNLSCVRGYDQHIQQSVLTASNP